VENGFPSDVLFNIQVLYERAGSSGKTAKDAKTPGAKPGAKPGAAGGDKDKKPKEDKAGTPDPFYCKLEHVKIRKGA